MSVMVRGMKMPKNCAECPLIHFHDEHAYCEEYELTYDWDEKLQEGRNENCPLIEIPTPHGRLIDADALKWNYIRIRDDGIKEFSQYGIDRAPTVIEKEPEEGEG